jgi:hypothetical protein
MLTKISFIFLLFLGEIMGIKNNIKNNDFILHLNGRRNGFGIAGIYDINITYTNKVLSVYLVSKIDTYVFDKNGIAIETDISKNKTKIFYLNNKENEYILYLLNNLKKNKILYIENFILSENIDNFAIETNNHTIQGVIYDNEYAKIIKKIVIFIIKQYGNDLNFLTHQGGGYYNKSHSRTKR